MPNNLSLTDRLLLGAEFLGRIKNHDGGIPAVKRGDPSGVWTTAESIEALIRCPWFESDFTFKVESMVAFLLQAQLRKRGADENAWPAVAGGTTASTMSTAHSIMALRLAKVIVPAQRRGAIDAAIHSGEEWLRAHQDGESGGWGVEPTGGRSGKEPRVLPTFLALRSLGLAGETAAASQTVRRGVDFLWALYDGNGFSPCRGQPVDTCSTIRAFLAINECHACHERQGFLEHVVNCVVSNKPPGSLWDLDVESYVPDGAAGQITYNHNSTAEVLEFLSITRTHQALQLQLVRWFEMHQSDDGSWPLGANSRTHPQIVTWPTNEAIIACARFVRAHDFSACIDENRPRPKRILLGVVSAVAVIEAIALIVVYNRSWEVLIESWQSQPTDFRRTFWWATSVGLAINVISAPIVYILALTVRRLWAARKK